MSNRSAFLRRSRVLMLLAALLAMSASTAAADAVADFYRGKTVTISVGFTRRRRLRLHARLLARHLGKHVPGAPAIVVKNVPGAAGLNLLNSALQHRRQGRHRAGDVRPRHPARSAVGAAPRRASMRSS